jgi:hypothetical protein
MLRAAQSMLKAAPPAAQVQIQKWDEYDFGSSHNDFPLPLIPISD